MRLNGRNHSASFFSRKLVIIEKTNTLPCICFIGRFFKNEKQKYRINRNITIDLHKIWLFRQVGDYLVYEGQSVHGFWRAGAR